MPDRTMKRGDTYEPITGVARDKNGRADLRGLTLLFSAQAKTPSGIVIIDPQEAVNVEDVEGPGGIDGTDGLPVNRGRWRFHQAVSDVAIPGIYRCEIQATLPDERVVTFPSEEKLNPELKIDQDIIP